MKGKRLMKNVIIAPSMLSADFGKLDEELKKIEATKAEYLHVDVMDGLFVPNISFGQPVIKSIRKCTDMFFDVHLMIEAPSRYIEDFAKSGADLITIHCEAEKNIRETLKKIHSLGIKTGLSVKPKTPVQEIYQYLDETDMVLIMTVEPGFGGQSFIEDCLPKIEALRKHIDDNHLDCLIEVDGGITDETIISASKAGAEIFVAGSFVFGKSDYSAAVDSLIEAANKAV